jgi:DNA polymerase-3 subunit delta'
MMKPLPPWLDASRRLLDEALGGARPPHALLLQGAQGLGVELLAAWTGARVLCRAAGARPCGRCSSCAAVARAGHPDLAWVTPLEDSKQIRIDEIRALIADFALKSHQGGYKVAILHPADALNSNAANALLKTLEEPAPKTLLVLVTHLRARLPATIVSRCQRLLIPRPAPAVAKTWLERELPGYDSSAALRFARGAPLRALELTARDFDSVDRDMQEAITRLRRAALDVPAVADQWTRAAKGALPDRITWLETWVTDDIVHAMTDPELRRPGGPAGLPVAHETLKIRSLYRVLDRLRQIRIANTTSLNMTMAVESLLLDLASALAATAPDKRIAGGRK